MNTGKYDYYISSYLTDGKRQASLPAIFLLLQESAWRHAETHSFGWGALVENNCIWALSRIKVLVDDYPRWQDNVHINTWSKEPDTVMAYRDFELFAQNGAKIMSATSAWLILNIENRRPQRMTALKDSFPVVRDKHAIEGALSKLPAYGNLSLPDACSVQTVPYSAIDLNEHVNNTMYLQWVIDSFPPEYVMSHDVCEAEINFLHESLAGQQYYVLYRETAENEYLCSVVKYPETTELARIRLKFRIRK
jgi:acyl-ACP thioesterase